MLRMQSAARSAQGCQRLLGESAMAVTISVAQLFDVAPDEGACHV